jgi:hypothetical protein
MTTRPDRPRHDDVQGGEAGLRRCAHSVQIGIRTECDDYLGVNVIDAREVHRDGRGRRGARSGRSWATADYLTFDIDALDPAFAPGTGTPVWGGLASWQAAAILRGLAGINLVGGDVVEVSPPYDTTGATAIAGAHVAMELICLYGWTGARSERAFLGPAGGAGNVWKAAGRRMADANGWAAIGQRLRPSVPGRCHDGEGGRFPPLGCVDHQPGIIGES